MANTSLREQARLANVSGDIRFQKEGQGESNYANLILDAMTNLAGTTSGDYKGEKWVERLKAGSKFIPVIGKPLSAGLSFIDLLADKKYTKKQLDRMDNVSTEGLKGPAKEYVEAHKDALVRKVEKEGKASNLQSLMNNLLNIGVQSGIPGKMSKSPMKTMIKTLFPSTTLAGTKLNKDLLPKIQGGENAIGNILAKLTGGKGLNLPKLFPQASAANQQVRGLAAQVLGGGEAPSNIHDIVKTIGTKKDNSLTRKLLAKLTGGRGLPSNMPTPDLFDLYQLAGPILARSMRKKQEPTYPEVPVFNRPSIRRRIN